MRNWLWGLGTLLLAALWWVVSDVRRGLARLISTQSRFAVATGKRWLDIRSPSALGMSHFDHYDRSDADVAAYVPWTATPDPAAISGDAHLTPYGQAVVMIPRMVRDLMTAHASSTDTVVLTTIPAAPSSLRLRAHRARGMWHWTLEGVTPTTTDHADPAKPTPQESKFPWGTAL